MTLKFFLCFFFSCSTGPHAECFQEMSLKWCCIKILFLYYFQVFILVRAGSMAYGGLKAAKSLHERLLKTVLQAPVLFFDTNPVSNS